MSCDYLNCTNSVCPDCTAYCDKQHKESLNRIKEYGPELMSFIQGSIGDDAMDLLVEENNLRAVKMETPFSFDQMRPQSFDKMYSVADKKATTVDKV